MHIRGSGARSPSIVARIVAVSLVAVCAYPAIAFSQDPSPVARFHRYRPPGASRPAPRRRALRSDERVQVVVTMTEDSVAAVRARTFTRAVSLADRQTVEQRVLAQHASVEPLIQARGGQVLRRFHSALNGVKVEIERGQLAALAALPGVREVVPVGHFRRMNVASVPFIGAPAVWQGPPGLRGEGVKIAIIDSGIDYTHANFGGPGTTAAFQAATAASSQAADPALFGPRAPKVKGGTDLVGDDYNPEETDDPAAPFPFQPTPHPDPNPLDCGADRGGDGHGSHVAGSAAGFGVAGGATYRGPYSPAAYQQTTFTVGPGVAPRADLYAVRVFGCTGPTDVLVDAIDWAVENDMDVISMSIGSDFGLERSADALAAQNATKAGILVVAASGNAGSAPYITSSPGTGDGVINVAASDAIPSFPGAAVTLDGAATIEALNANGATMPGAPLGIVVLRDAAGNVSTGCKEAEYVDGTIAGKLVVTVRGDCDRLFRVVAGQRHGAAAVAMINTEASYPPFEGPISLDGVTVTIPFLGVLGSDAAKLTAAGAASLAANTLPNPTFRAVADFSSGGPRSGDSQLKPNVTAPGVSIASTAVGTGTAAVVYSGTSMATPQVAGVAALARQAHPGWSLPALTAAVVQTADPGQIGDYGPRLAGTGLVQPAAATRTDTVVSSSDPDNGLSFGFGELVRDYSASRDLAIHNHGQSAIVFNVSATPTDPIPHKVTFDRATVSVGGRGDATLKVRLDVPAATVGGTRDADGNPAFHEVAGYVTLTPARPSMNGGVSLHVPYYLVPRTRSRLEASLGNRLGPSRPTAAVKLTNTGAVLAATADFYAWGLAGKRQGVKPFDARAIGVHAITLPAEESASLCGVSASNSLLVFAVNTFDRFSSAAAGEFEILVDATGDGKPDFDLVAADLGLLTGAGSAVGQLATAVIDVKTGQQVDGFLAVAPTDGSTLLLPACASDLGLTPANPRFTYAAKTHNVVEGTAATVPGTATFNAFSPALSRPAPVAVAPNATATVPITLDKVEWTKTPALGVMVVTEDNKAGAPQAQLLEASQR